jgi:hypothetical protein
VASCPDVAPECATTFIPAHEHHVRLTLVHSELEASYGLRPQLAMSLRLPYDVKQQRVRYTTLDGAPFVPPYGDIHHRSETLRGVSDGDLLLLYEPVPRGASRWHFGLGTTLPFGKTVADPIALGREGKKHEHLQFGSGVFAPEAELGWTRPIANFIGAAFVQLTVPVTTSSRGFRAPRNLRWSAGPTFTHGGVAVTVDVAGQYQTIGRWHGEADEGTGFSNGGVRLQVSLPLGATTITPSVYRELYSHGLNDETFSQGTTLALSIRRSF